MRSKIVIGVALLLIALMPGAAPAAQATPTTASQMDEPSQANIMEAYARLPLLFIHNQGQLDSQVEYYVKTRGQTIYFTPSGMVFDLVRYQNAKAADAADRKAERLAFSLDLLSASTSPLIEGIDKDRAVVNYLIGNDPQKWHTGIPTYKEVVYNDVYPGIDLRLYGKEGCLEYELILQPGADISDIALAYDGVESLDMESGELVVGTAFGDFNQSQPYIYQQIGDDLIAVEGGFRLLGANSYGFYAGAYDAGYPLIIDPPLTLGYSSYLGGSSGDYGLGIAVESGYAYITGYTDSTDLPTVTPCQTDQTGTDAFVAKFDTTTTGTSLIYSTYLGGNGTDMGRGIAVESGYAYVTGETASINFPTVTPYQIDQGGTDAFVTKLATTGSSLIYSTYLGGTNSDAGYGIAVESGYAYVTGLTNSTDFPKVNHYQTDPGDTDYDAFVTKLNTTGASLAYSTYLGGDDSDEAWGIAVESGCAYVTGRTDSTDFPKLNNYHANQTGTDAFVSKINTALIGVPSLIYSTYLGGNAWDVAYGIAVESGYAYVTGATDSTDFPTVTPYMVDKTSTDAFVSKINTALIGVPSLIYSTYLGGTDIDEGDGIAVDSGCAYVTGHTYSSDFPTVNPYQTDPDIPLSPDAFVTRLNTSGDNLIYSTYLGGNSTDEARGIAVESGYAYVTGYTGSTDFPTVNWYQTDQGVQDAFVSKFNATTRKLMGTDTAGNGSTGNNKLILCRFYNTEADIVNQIRLYSRASGSVKVGIYTDSAGVPGTLLNANSQPTAVTASQWNNIYISPTPVTGSTWYWLAAVCNTSGAISYNTTSGSGTSRGKGVTFSSFVFPKSAGTGYTSYTYERAFAGWVDIDPSATQRLVGSTTDGNGSTGGNKLILCRFLAAQTGTLNQISVYSRASGNVKVAIYSDSAGAPGTLLNSNNTSTAVTASQWNDIYISPTHITSSTWYWLGAVGNATGAISYNTTPGSGTSRGKSVTFSSFKFPKTIGTTGWTSYTYERAFSGFGTP